MAISRQHGETATGAGRVSNRTRKEYTVCYRSTHIPMGHSRGSMGDDIRTLDDTGTWQHNFDNKYRMNLQQSV